MDSFILCRKSKGIWKITTDSSGVHRLYKYFPKGYLYCGMPPSVEEYLGTGDYVVLSEGDEEECLRRLTALRELVL